MGNRQHTHPDALGAHSRLVWTKTAEDVPPTFNLARADGHRTYFPIGVQSTIGASSQCPGTSEWKTMRDGQQPYYISAADGGVLSIAGVWDAWNNIATCDVVSSCSIITTGANAFTRAVHNRMPALLQRKDFP